MEETGGNPYVVIFSVVVKVTGDLRLVSACLENTVDVRKPGDGDAQQKSKISKKKTKK